MCIGFKDKLYWRDPSRAGIFHCFKKYRGQGFAPLCGRGRPIKRSGGQAINRPEPAHRCGQCDGMEMKRRGWTESGPATVADEQCQQGHDFVNRGDGTAKCADCGELADVTETGAARVADGHGHD